MSGDEGRLSRLLHEVVPDPEVVVEFDDLRRMRARRRRTSMVIAAAAAVAVAIPVTWWIASPDDGRPEVVSQPSSSPTAKVTSAGEGCPATKKLPGGQAVMVDYVDFVQFEGRQYVAGLGGDVSVAPGDLWRVLGEVSCKISDLTDKGDRTVVGPFLDRNAAFLPVGTELRAVSGYDQSCRIAASVGGEFRVYLAQHDVDGTSKPLDCALTPSPGAPRVTRCAQLPPVPAGVEVNTWIDEKHGLFEYSYGNDNATFRVAYRDDPTCRDRADVTRLVDRSRTTGNG